MELNRYFTFLILLLLATQGFSQSFGFGRNKVQYTDFDWQILETEHFNIYYYSEMKEAAEKGAAFAAGATGFALEKTIKTLVVDLGRKQYVLVLMPGDRRLSM